MREKFDAPIGQKSLFPEWQDHTPPKIDDSPLITLPIIDLSTTIGAVALHYRNHLMRQEHTTHTIDCFLSDLRLLSRFLGLDTRIEDIDQQRLTDWLMHLRWDSDARPAPKTMARRVTFLKNFFGWLEQEKIVEKNIAATLIFQRPLPPLPDILFEDDLARLTQAATEPRSALLVMLALDGGLKKEEILALTPDRVDLSDPEHPTISVRLPGPSRPQRERMIELPTGFSAIYLRYVQTYHPQGTVFDCTDRNLTYILARIVKRAQITKRVTLQLLRDCYAVRQLRAGASLADLREKLGLSDEAWYEAQEKYRKLAFPV